MLLNVFECYNFSATHNIIDEHIFGHKYDGSVECLQPSHSFLLHSYIAAVRHVLWLSHSGPCYRIRYSKKAVVIKLEWPDVW